VPGQVAEHLARGLSVEVVRVVDEDQRRPRRQGPRHGDEVLGEALVRLGHGRAEAQAQQREQVLPAHPSAGGERDGRRAP